MKKGTGAKLVFYLLSTLVPADLQIGTQASYSGSVKRCVPSRPIPGDNIDLGTVQDHNNI